MDRYTSWDKTVEALLEGFATAEERKKLFAEFALGEREIASAVNRAAFDREPSYETYVDGRKGASEYDVNPNRGRIIYEFDLMRDLIKWIGQRLVEVSPIGDASDMRPGHPGLYQDSHAFYADDVRVPMGHAIPDASEYVYVNTTPYARKMEPPTAQSDQARKGVYMAVAAEARDKFKFLIDIRYGFRTLSVDQDTFRPFIGKTQLASNIMNKRGDASPAGRQRAIQLAREIHHSLSQSRQPAIIIRP